MQLLQLTEMCHLFDDAIIERSVSTNSMVGHVGTTSGGRRFTVVAGIEGLAFLTWHDQRDAANDAA